MTDTPAISDESAARRLIGDLRPQAFGTAQPHSIPDPIVEPMWVGVRVLGAVTEGSVALVDGDGETLVGFDEFVAALGVAVPSGTFVIDGFITKQAAHQAGPATTYSDEMPSMSGFIGLRRNRAEDATKLKEAALAASQFEPDDVLALVAIDLLLLDETPLLDIPLLERRRLLESVVVESDAIRVGAYVRPPIDHWVNSWRMLGFGGLTYKATNSRYLPGATNPEWVVAGMPRR